MLLGAFLAYMRHVPGRIYGLIERFFILKIDIQDEDEAYHWMQIWLAERLEHTLSISVVTKRQKPNKNAWEDEEAATGNVKPTIYFVPAVGTYFFWYKGRFVTLNRDKQENTPSMGMPGALTGDANKPGLARAKESLTFRIFSRNKNLARELIEEARDKAIPEDGKLDIRIAYYSSWTTGTRIKPRALDSVILDGNQAEELTKDIEEFIKSKDWYQKVGVPWRRSYLFHGDPGNGKTSVAKGIAGYFKMNIYLLVLSDPDMNDNRINDLLSKVPENNIILLEDIDCAFNKRDRQGKEGLTFSGLLNAIDGVASPEGRIFFMTTNYIDKLDPALIRPGRADVKIHFGNATRIQAERLYNRFFEGRPELGEEFSKSIPERRYSMAVLQDYLMLHKNHPERAVLNVGLIGDLQVSKKELLESPPLLLVDSLSDESEGLSVAA